MISGLGDWICQLIITLMILHFLFLSLSFEIGQETLMSSRRSAASC